METFNQLILEKEILNGEIKSILFYHNTDRLYFGDLLRHASWIESLGSLKAKLTVSTHRTYLPIFENHPFVKNLIAVDKISEEDFKKYDLVIVPSSFPSIYLSPFIKRGIYSDNINIRYTRYSSVVKKIKKNELNYFNLANHTFGQTYLPNGSPFRLHLTSKEKDKGAEIINSLFSGKQKIIVLNPTASNNFTRENNVKKEVLNLLNINDYTHIIKNLLIEFPDHHILLGAGFKPNDHENFKVLEKLEKIFNTDKVKSVTSITSLEKGLSFRDFGSIISNKRVVGMLGNGTGTNAHFAATLGIPAMSIERSSDRDMRNNWRSLGTFQMGSFRWRNPNLSISIYVLNWSSKNPDDFRNIVNTFKTHLMVVNKQWSSLFKTNDADLIRSLASESLNFIKSRDILKASLSLKRIAENLKDINIKNFYFNFKDEEEYLNIIHKELSSYLKFLSNNKSIKTNLRRLKDREKTLILNLIKDSNLYKLITHISLQKDKLVEKDANLLAGTIFRKTRAGVLLTKKELKLLHFASELAFREWIDKQIQLKIDSIISKYELNKKNKIIGPWQQRVYSNESEIILKIIDPNKTSIYFNTKDTTNDIVFARNGSGGLIPFESELRIFKKEKVHLVRKINVFLPLKDNCLNKKIFKRKNIYETILPFGWIDEHILNFINLARRGIYNMDPRFTENGIDEFGCFYSVDSGSFKNINLLKSNKSLIKDPLYLGINEFARNRVLLNKFKNGANLVKYYDSEIKKHLGIDLSPLSLGWKWGDHNTKLLHTTTRELKRFLDTIPRVPASPVYPLLNFDISIDIRNIIRNRMSV